MATVDSPNKPQEVSYSRPPAGKSGAGGTVVFLLLLVLLIGGGAFAYSAIFGDEESGQNEGALLYTVAKNDILVTVTEDGNVESASNVDVKCSVSGGSTILWIVEDGTTVSEGDEIVKLDTANLEDQLNTQKMNYERAMATRIQATEDFEASKLSVREYEEGTYIEELKKAEAEIRIAQENHRSSENVFNYTKKMVRKGFATALQREADQFAVERAQLDLEAAQTRKKVLEEFTKQKALKDLEAKREAAAAKARADEAAFDLEQVRLERLKKQMENCVIKAPQNGMVVYANDGGRSRFGGSQEIQIEEGAMVRERQALIRLPDLTQMQVKVTVHESKVDLLKRGMPARIVIQDVDYKGKVVSVANQPEPTSFFSANVKEYATIVAIEGEATDLRPGMTAHVEILVADLQDVLTLPISSVVDQRGGYFCWVKTKDGYRKQEVELGRTNDKSVHVITGVEAGDEVVRNPKSVIDEATKEVPEEDTGRDRSQFGEGDTESESAGDNTQRPERNRRGPPSGGPPSGGGQPGAGASAGGGSGRPSGGASGGGLELPESGKAYIAKYDKDADGKVAQTELDERSQQSAQFWFSRVDTDGDGSLDETEADAMIERFKSFRSSGGGSGGTPGGGRPEGTPEADANAGGGRPSGVGGSGSGGRFDMMQYDKDGDGKVTKEEAPEFMQSFFDRIDLNGDGSVTAKEIAERRKQREQQGGGEGGGAPGGSGGPPQ